MMMNCCIIPTVAMISLVVTGGITTVDEDVGTVQVCAFETSGELATDIMVDFSTLAISAGELEDTHVVHCTHQLVHNML